MSNNLSECRFVIAFFLISIRGLAVSEVPKSKASNSSKVNYDAGADVLHHFQMQWNQLHELAEDNAGKAQCVDALVTVVYEKLEREWNSIICLNTTLASIPKINNAIQNLMDQIGKGQILLYKD